MFYSPRMAYISGYSMSTWKLCAVWCYWVFYKWHLDQFGWYCCSNLLSFPLFILLISERNVLESLRITGDWSVSPCNALRFCSVYVEALFIKVQIHLGTYTFRIVISFWLIIPYIIKWWHRIFVIIFLF